MRFKKTFSEITVHIFGKSGERNGFDSVSMSSDYCNGDRVGKNVEKKTYN